ncbi:MAG: DUF4838 domain-containing protein [Armatimonadetes bacterium]|nr:DUF4838 domain-containing protein [Armatimonadota bacterium]
MTVRHCCLVTAIVILGAIVTSAHAGIALVSQGRSDYRIVVPREASLTERQAATELQWFLKRISGAELTIVDDRKPIPSKAILLANNSHLRKIGVRIDFPGLGQEGFVIRTAGPHLLIAGGQPRGTLYGVYTFLEERLGCRWFSSKVHRVPHLPTITLDQINDTQVPVLEYREPFWFDAFDANWALRNKSNSANARLDTIHGGKIVYTGFVHTFNSLVPPEKYFDQHPEYFSLIGGKRMKGYYQLCLTNPDVLRITIEAVKGLLRQHPETNIVSVSQNDAGGWCECESCKKVEQEEGGVHAGPIIRFVNAVAEAIEKEFPEVAVDTLAYSYSRQPVTRTRPRHNVIVRLCSIECCFSHPLEEEDTSFKKDIVGWSKMCDRLYVWDYVTTFGHYVLPFSNIEVLQPNVQFFVNHGVKGIFEEGAYQSNGAEMAELKAYLLAKILWNPNCDVERHRREFMEACYGKAADPIDRYLRMVRDYAMQNKIHEPIWIGPTTGHVPPDLVTKANALFDEAETAVAEDPATLHRVQVARLPLQYVQLSRLQSGAPRPWRVHDDVYGPDPDSEQVKLADRFFSVCEKEKITHLNEGAFHPNTLRDQVAPQIYGVKLLTLENAAIRLRIAPAMGGRIVAVEDKIRNRNLAALPTTVTPNFRSMGGYAEAAGYSKYSPGAREPFTVEGQATVDRVALTARFENGLALTRTIQLSKEEPGWTVESTLKNLSDQPRAARLRTTFDLSLGGENVTLAVDGKDTPLTIPAEATETKVACFGSSVSKQAWQLSGPSGAGIQCQVAGEVQRFLFTNHADGPSVSVQTLTREKALQPNETLTLTAGYTLVSATGKPAAKTAHQAAECDVQEDEFTLYREGELSAVREDSTASDGFVGWMGGNHIEWAIQWPIDPSRLQANATYEISAVVRFDVKGREGGACTFGVYDVDKGSGPCGGSLGAADAKTTWQTITVGRLKPEGNQYVWIAPTGNASNVGAVYVDKFVFKQVLEQ